MAHSSECTDRYAQKVLDGADIVRDAMLHSTDDPRGVLFPDGWKRDPPEVPSSFILLDKLNRIGGHPITGSQL